MFSAATKTQLLLASAFFQNDEVFRADILDGRYTQPLGVKGVTQVDVRDIAEIAATLLLDPSHPAGCFPITGPEAVSGPDAGCDLGRNARARRRIRRARSRSVEARYYDAPRRTQA